MKSFMQSPRRSIFGKIVMTFLGLLIPLCSLNLFMNESGADAVRSEIVNSMNTKVELYMNLIESDVERIVKLIQAYVNDEDLMKLSTSASIMTDIEKTQSILALKSKLDLFEESSRFVHQVNAFIPLLNRSVTSNDNSITAFDQAQFEALCVTTNRYEAPFLQWNGRLFISVPSSDPVVLEGKEPLFLLTVELSERELRNALRQFTTNGEQAVLAGNHLPWSISSGSESSDSDAGSEKFLVVGKSSSRLDSTLSIYMPENRIFGSLKRYRYWLILLTSLSVAVIIFFAFSIYRIIQRPLRTLVRSLNKVEQGNFNFVLTYPLKDEFGFLYRRFNAMVKELNVLVHEVYEQKYRVRLAELRQLQSQINPHFLYNSFFILHRMAKLHDNENIERFTKFLGEYFQFITRDGVHETTLETEAKYARTYMDIQSFRFANRIHGEFGELPEEIRNLQVPRLILQPLIENAYNHGLENKKKDGWIRVSFRADGGMLLVAVEDNGEELNEEKLQSLCIRLYVPEEASESTGLINVHRRLRIKYGQAGGVSLSLGESGGLRAELRIPLGREEDEHVPAAHCG
ncbi:sensor histidine kinase [Paenibacillus arenilitoris]|uniref:Histidine kinase n=1 Tax=Paenibacillus arenilitoris TaxID=2772299 RepID=A0A927CLU4_9BACL|nr:histidine kinase [Paenibacillus arenilitoris]MBD2868958.1 histidine kinase [Paenibacillus arenilitoris]